MQSNENSLLRVPAGDKFVGQGVVAVRVSNEQVSYLPFFKKKLGIKLRKTTTNCPVAESRFVLKNHYH